jgi:hypothetical protein
VTDALLAFLHHLPERELLCFVGLDAVQADVADDEVELTGPRAASTDVGVATGNFATPGVLALQAAEVTGATPDPDEAGTLAREVAQALKRDRAHEPHPDLPPGRFQGGLVPSPPGTWELERLDSAERPDFDAMTSEERRAWFAAREASSAERFAEAEPGPLNPQKAADYPHFRRVRSRPEDDDRQ